MRIFPDPTNDAFTAFAYHSTRIERIPISKADIDHTLAGSKINPYLEGQYKAANLILTLAPNENLIPETHPTNWQETLEQITFLKKLHTNLFKTVADYGALSMNPDIISLKQVGEWRDERKWIVDKEMPSPIMIPHLLHDWWTDLIDFHNQYRNKIELPHLLEDDDIKSLVNKAYESNLKLCCIKPFTDGSNRVARCTENLLRLNWGLPFKIIRHEDEYKLPYIDDIKKMQSQYPA